MMCLKKKKRKKREVVYVRDSEALHSFIISYDDSISQLDWEIEKKIKNSFPVYDWEGISEIVPGRYYTCWYEDMDGEIKHLSIYVGLFEFEEEVVS